MEDNRKEVTETNAKAVILSVLAMTILLIIAIII